MSAKIEGMFVPNIVPLDDEGQIAEEELRRFVDWLIDRGVNGLYPNGSTGEFTRFTAEERQRINRIVCEQAAGRATVLAGAAEGNVRETLRACEAAAGFGARAVAIVAPFYYRLSADAVYEFFREIAESSPIDITLYNIPMFASPIDIETLKKLAEMDRVVAIKDSSGDVANLTRMIAAVRPLRPDFSFLSGWEAALLPSLIVGCDGGTNASSNVVPEWTTKLFALARSGQYEEARSLQFRLLEVFDLMLGVADFPAGFRLGVELRGFRLGKSRQPLGDTQRAALAEARDRLSALLVEFL